MGSDGEHGSPTLQEAMSVADGATGVTSSGRVPPGTPSLMRRGRGLRAALSERDMRATDLICDITDSTTRLHAWTAGATGNWGSGSHLSEASSQTATSTDNGGSLLKAGRHHGLSPCLSFPRGEGRASVTAGDPSRIATQATKHARGGSDPSMIGRPAMQQQLQLLPTAPVPRPGSDLVAGEAWIAAAAAATVATSTAAAAAAASPPAGVGGVELARPASSIADESGPCSGGAPSGDGLVVRGSRAGDRGAAATTGAPGSVLPGSMSSGDAAMLLATAVSEAASFGHDRGRWSRLIPSYKQRSDEFKRLFKGVPDEERLLVDYSCALKKDFLVHGRLYVSQNWICFYANLFGWESAISIPLREVTAVNKCRTVKVIPNAIQITTAKDRFLFSSFVARDQTYLVIFRAWMCVLSENPITGPDLWALVRWLYGAPEEVGQSEDEPHIASEAVEELPPAEHSMDGSHIECEPVERSGNESVRSTAIGDVESVALNGTTVAHSKHSSSSSSSSSSNDSSSIGSSCVASDEPGTDEDHDAVNLGDDDDGDGAGPALEGCPSDDHEHTGVQVLDCTLDFAAHELFALLFTDSPFFADFLTKRATSDLVLSAWPQSPDAEGKRRRTITYTLAINASFGPKRSPATEVQTVLPETVPGRFYAVDCECLNAPTLPYGENFYVLNKYCIRRLSSATCRLVVHSDIVYVKSVYKIVKGIIQRNVATGVKGYLHQLNENLLAEARKRGTPPSSAKAGHGSTAAGEPGGGHGNRRRRHHRYGSSAAAAAVGARADDKDRRITSRGSAGPEAREAGGQAGETAKQRPAANAVNKPERQQQDDSSSVRHGSFHRRLLLNAALCLLLAANILMFCHTWWLDAAHLALSGAKLSGAGSVPDEAAVHAQLEQHRLGHEREAEHWRELVESSVDMIYRLRRDIEELRNLVTERNNQSQVYG